MSRNPLYLVAGVDAWTLADCPPTDKLWAAQLGLSLALSFTVVLGITFHATGYVVTEVWVRILVAVVVALTIFLFDRALYQSDWFYQTEPCPPATGGGSERPANPWAPLRRFGRIAVRLSISFGLAWVIAVFLELAVFSDTISEKIKRDYLAANQATFQRIEQYELNLGTAIEHRRSNLAALETLYRQELASSLPASHDDDYPQRMHALEQRISNVNAQQERLTRELREIEAKIAIHAEEMNAEELGQRINLASTGRAGTGPRYEFARRQKAVQEARHAELQREIALLRANRQDLQSQQRRLSEDAAARREAQHAAASQRREALRGQIETARQELRELETSRLTNIEDFRSRALAGLVFQKPKDDPLARMTAYQELKNDPKDGATITLFSWMTKFLVIFLEVVPVMAKMFFAPPSVYAARIQAQVAREREKVVLPDHERTQAEPDESQQAPLGPRTARAAPPKTRSRSSRSRLGAARPPDHAPTLSSHNVSPDERARDFAGPVLSSPRFRDAEPAPRGPILEASPFNPMDLELEREWQDLMETVEVGNFGTPRQNDDAPFDASESGRR